MTDELDRLAGVLDDAARSATPVEQLTRSMRLSLDDAYVVQQRLVARQVMLGDWVVGVKLGFTSPAKAAQMGVADVIIGQLTERMRIPEGGRLRLDSFIHPRSEPEVAFRFRADVDPLDDSVIFLDAIEAVAPAVEIIDSRYRDFSFSLADVVADNTSASAYVLGHWIDLAAAGDLRNRGVRMELDGRIVEVGSTGAILGDPRRALEVARRLARTHGLRIPGGAVLLAGAATASVPLADASWVDATITGVGSVSFAVDGARNG